MGAVGEKRKAAVRQPVSRNPRNITTMLPTSSYPCLAALRSAASLPCTPARPKAALAMVLLVLALVLPLPGAVLGDYENTWNSYYEQPCCGGTTNGPFHLRHHGGRWFQFADFHSVARSAQTDGGGGSLCRRGVDFGTRCCVFYNNLSLYVCRALYNSSCYVLFHLRTCSPICCGSVCECFKNSLRTVSKKRTSLRYQNSTKIRILTNTHTLISAKYNS